MATTRKQTEIQSASVARGTDKLTHRVYYVVRSDSADAWHQVKWSDELTAWQCDGEFCKQYQANGTTCKHARATCEVLKLRRQRIAAAMGPEVAKTVKHWQADADRRQHGALNGNRPVVCNDAGVPMR